VEVAGLALVLCDRLVPRVTEAVEHVKGPLKVGRAVVVARHALGCVAQVVLVRVEGAREAVHVRPIFVPNVATVPSPARGRDQHHVDVGQIIVVGHEGGPQGVGEGVVEPVAHVLGELKG